MRYFTCAFLQTWLNANKWQGERTQLLVDSSIVVVFHSQVQNGKVREVDWELENFIPDWVQTYQLLHGLNQVRN